MGTNLIKKNIAANFIGNIWQALMGLAFVPLYLKFLGVEAYGLIGVFTTLQATFGILDMGISATLTREMARLSVLPGKEQEMRDLVRSLELIYWGVAIGLGIIVILMAPLITHHWVNPGRLSSQTVEQSIRIIGFVVALQWPASFYSGGLIGLQKQVLLNGINVAVSTFRGFGAVLILWLISPTIQAFFLWQIIISAVNTFSLGLLLWQALPQVSKKASFRRSILAGVWRFAAGMTGISILATILTQMDKIILSKMLPLEVFGYYTLAGVVSLSLYRVIGPVFSAVYPKLTELVALADYDGLKQLYHKSCQFMSVLILPITAVTAMFSYEILILWTRDPVTTEKTYFLLSILICGTALNGLMNIPYALQLAHGWTKLGLYLNMINVLLLAPMIFFMTKYYGALGGASVWLGLNTSYFFIAIPLVHRRFLPHENWRWYLQDVGAPFIVSIFIAGIGRLLMRGDKSPFENLIGLIIISASTLIGAALTTTTTRSWLFSKYKLIKKTLFGSIAYVS